MTGRCDGCRFYSAGTLTDSFCFRDRDFDPKAAIYRTTPDSSCARWVRNPFWANDSGGSDADRPGLQAVPALRRDGHPLR